MACATCRRTILLGGKKSGQRRYCNQSCYDADKLGRIGDTIEDGRVDQLAHEIRLSECPVCNKRTGVEIYKSYFVYSLVIITSWKEKPLLCCKSCGRKNQIIDLLASSVLGWWGFPFGLIVTPVIIIANLVALTKDASSAPPSKALKERARLLLAHDQMAESSD